MAENNDEREQLEALIQLLMRVRSGLEKIDPDGEGSTAYMHARNARLDLNEALRRLNYLQNRPDAYPLPPRADSPE